MCCEARPGRWASWWAIQTRQVVGTLGLLYCHKHLLNNKIVLLCVRTVFIYLTILWLRVIIPSNFSLMRRTWGMYFFVFWRQSLFDQLAKGLSSGFSSVFVPKLLWYSGTDQANILWQNSPEGVDFPWIKNLGSSQMIARKRKKSFNSRFCIIAI